MPFVHYVNQSVVSPIDRLFDMCDHTDTESHTCRYLLPEIDWPGNSGTGLIASCERVERTRLIVAEWKVFTDTHVFGSNSSFIFARVVSVLCIWRACLYVSTSADGAEDAME